MNEGGGRLAIPVGADDHAQGPDDAAVTLVEYGDYECPYCGQAFPIVQELQRVFAESLRLVFRNLPLSNVHPHAEGAAEAAEAVALQGRFWAMHDLLYQHQRELRAESLLKYAEEAGADATQVAEVLARRGTRARVENDLEGALRSGANGTPTFFVNGSRYDQSWDFDTLREFIQAELDRG
jgi:protein-disulfide isomerase